MKKKKTIFAPYLMLLFAVIGMAIASYDVYAIYNNQLLWCPPPIDGCNTVAYSPYGRIYGVPFGALGLIFYLIMFAFGGTPRVRLVLTPLALGCASLHCDRRALFNILLLP